MFWIKLGFIAWEEWAKSEICILGEKQGESDDLGLPQIWKPAYEHTMNDVEEYLAKLPNEQRDALEKLRAVILSVAKGAEEKISYGMPTVV